MRDLKVTFGTATPIHEQDRPDYARKQIERQTKMLEEALARRVEPNEASDKAIGSAHPTHQWQAMAMQQQVGALIKRTPEEITEIQQRQLKSQRAIMLQNSKI